MDQINGYYSFRVFLSPRVPDCYDFEILSTHTYAYLFLFDEKVQKPVYKEGGFTLAGGQKIAQVYKQNFTGRVILQPGRT